MQISNICRYCGGVIRRVPARVVYGDAAGRMGLEHENIYLCQNCNARVGCHKGTNRPLGNVANEVLRLKRRESHQVFDAYWKKNGMKRSRAYRWLAEQMELSEEKAHIGGFEMDDCERLIGLCKAASKNGQAA